MKEVVKEELVKQVTRTWVAEDGKVFDSENACHDYELSFHIKEAEEKYNRLVIGSPYFPFMDWCNDSFQVDIVMMKTKDDWYTVKDYARALGLDSYGLSDIKKFPCVYPIGITDYSLEPSGWNLEKLQKETWKSCDKINELVEEAKRRLEND